MQVRTDDRRLLQGRDEIVVDVVDLDRREPRRSTPSSVPAARMRPASVIAAARSRKQPRLTPVSIDLAVPLCDAAADLAEDGVGAAAAGGAAHERDHAEGTRERAAVLDLHERLDPVEPRVRLHAADRPDVAGDRLDRLLDLAGDDRHVRGQASECRLGDGAPQPVT